MAHARIRKLKPISCFYCGCKSSKKHDGTVRQWECPRCEAVNYFDENGDITDPPVATADEVPMTVQYARPRSTSPINNNDIDQASIFCPKCVQNQHLYTVCLAQYCPEGEDTMEYEPLNRDYYNFRRQLEERYPQVCEECEPKALAQIKQAGYTAKTDHLRRLMEQTKARKVPTKAKRKGLSWITIFDDAGRSLWWMGILGQLLWHVTFLGESFTPELKGILALPSMLPLTMYVSRLYTLLPFSSSLRNFWFAYFSPSSYSAYWEVPVQARFALISSIIAFYWNPKFQEACRGFTGHITGYKDWYSFQVVSLAVRLVFKYMADRGIFASMRQTPVIAAHLFMLCFISILLVKSKRCLRTNLTPLFGALPKSLRPAKKSKKLSEAAPRNMIEALDDIEVEPVQDASVKPLQEKQPISLRESMSQLPVSRRVPRQDQPFFGVDLPSRSTPSLTNMNDHEALQYLTTGLLPPRLQHLQGPSDEDQMDWSPTQPNHRAFIPQRPNDGRTLETFNSSPPVPEQESSPFWYKVPPEPITPAQRLRNPPNQARLTVAPPKVKENFFQSLTGRSKGFSQTNTSTAIKIENSDTIPTIRKRVEMNLAQPKFFPPNRGDDEGNELTDLFGKAFSLQDQEQEQDPGGSSTVSMYEDIIQTVGGLPLIGFVVVFVGIASGIVYKMVGVSSVA